MTTSEVREQQRAVWNKFSSGWKKNDEFVGQWLQPMGEKLLEMARLSPGYVVLDAATGTGEPGLTAARRVGPGKVIGSDIAEEMLKVAEAKASAARISNYETRLADESALPFSDGSFDAVLCRLGVMYFPDPLAAIREFARVVKPGRVVALSAWAEPQKNPWATLASGIVNRMLEVPPPPPGAPGLFRSGAPGSLTSLLTQAGLRPVSEVEVAGTLRFASAETYWEFITDVVAPVVTALSKVDQEKQKAVGQAVIEAARKEQGSGAVTLSWSSWVASATR